VVARAGRDARREWCGGAILPECTHQETGAGRHPDAVERRSRHLAAYLRELHAQVGDRSEHAEARRSERQRAVPAAVADDDAPVEVGAEVAHQTAHRLAVAAHGRQHDNGWRRRVRVEPTYGIPVSIPVGWFRRSTFGLSSDFGSSSPFLNARIDRPRLSPSSGSLLGPKMTRTTTNTTNRCNG